MNSDACNQILEAAGPVFADKGFDKSTIREICRKANVNLAAVNYYFGDKKQLYLQTVRRAYETRARQVPMPDWDSTAPPEQKLREFIMTLARRMMGLDEAPWPTRLMMREVLQPTEACKTLVEDYFRPQMQILITILSEMLPDVVPRHRVQKLAFSIIGQCLFYRVSRDVVSLMIPSSELSSHYQVDQIGHHIAETMLAALRQPSSAWLEPHNSLLTN